MWSRIVYFIRYGDMQVVIACSEPNRYKLNWASECYIEFFCVTLWCIPNLWLIFGLHLLCLYLGLRYHTISPAMTFFVFWRNSTFWNQLIILWQFFIFISFGYIRCLRHTMPHNTGIFYDRDYVVILNFLQL